MKFLSFSHDANLFGAQRSLLGLLQGLQKRGHQITLVCPGKGPLVQNAQAAGLPVELCQYPYPSRRLGRAAKFMLSYPLATGRIRKLVSKIQPDVIHFNTSSCIAPSMALKRVVIPKLHHLRERAPAISFTGRIIADGCDLAIANCDYIAEQYPILRDRTKIKTVHNGLDVTTPNAERIKTANDIWGIDKNSVNVLFAGQLRPHKDPMAVLEVARQLQNSPVSIRFGIIGDGPELPKLEQRIRHLGLQNYVWLGGFQKDALAFIAAADIVFIPSIVEPFPRIGLEAMGLRKAIVSTRTGGIPEQIISGESGLLRRPKNYIGMSYDIERLSMSLPFRKEIADNGFRRQQALFNQQSYAVGVESIALDLLRE